MIIKNLLDQISSTFPIFLKTSTMRNLFIFEFDKVDISYNKT